MDNNKGATLALGAAAIFLGIAIGAGLYNEGQVSSRRDTCEFVGGVYVTVRAGVVKFESVILCV